MREDKRQHSSNQRFLIVLLLFGLSWQCGAINHCHSCSLVFVFPEFYFKCNNCHHGYYRSSNRRNCHSCDTACDGCSGGGDTQCSQCKWTGSQKYYKWPNNRCSQTCSTGYYPDDSEKECKGCSQACTGGCTGAGDLNCVNCKWTATDKYYRWDSNNKCSMTCQHGFYKDDDTKKCEPCDIACNGCTEAGIHHCGGCNRSADPMYSRWKTDNRCSQTCPPNTYPDDSTEECEPCHTACNGCTASGDLSCTQCKWLTGVADQYYRWPSNQKCSTNCDHGFYKDRDSKQCVACNAACNGCQGSTRSDCDQCRWAGSDKYFLWSTGECSLTCPPNHYGDHSTKGCEPCDQACDECSAAGDLACTNCKWDGTNNYLRWPTNSKCSTTCDTGYFPNTSTKECEACHTSCGACTAAGDGDCSSCKWNPPEKYYKKTDGKCSQTCPPGYYGDDGEKECKLCDPACSECDGPAASQCVQCRYDVNGDKYYRMIGAGWCLATCPTGTYADDSTGRCESCHPACQECTGEGDLLCTQCTWDGSNKYYRWKNTNKCSTACPFGYYKDDSTKACEECFEGCVGCSAAGDLSCTACKFTSAEKYYEWKNNGKCSLTCEHGLYGDDSTKKCENCDPACDGCTAQGDQSCSQCAWSPPGTKYYLWEQNSQCRATCPIGTYPLDSTKKCEDCHPACDGCSSGDDLSCLQCTWTGTGKYYRWPNERCSKDCERGFYADDSTKNCLPCSEACEHCDAEGDLRCLVCTWTDSERFFRWIRNQKCSKICEDGFYGDLKTRECRLCDEYCDGCLEAGDQNCIKCKWTPTQQYYKFLIDAKKTAATALTTTTANINSGEDFRCIEKCPDGYYQNKTTQMCEKCDESCEACTDSGNLNCTACHWSQGSEYYRWPSPTNKCSKTCEDGYYQDEAKKTCEPCHLSCDGCSAGGDLNCTKCAFTDKNKNYRWATSSRCSQRCERGYAPNKETRECESTFGYESGVFLSENQQISLKFNQKLDPAIDNENLGFELFSGDNLQIGIQFTSLTLDETQKTLLITVDIEKSVKNGKITITQKPSKKAPITSIETKAGLKQQNITIENVEHFKPNPQQQKAIESTTKAASAGLNTIFVIGTLNSIAFDLVFMRIFQMLDFLIFLNVVHPSNLKVFSSSMKLEIIENFPNIFSRLVDGVCEIEKEQFKEEGVGCFILEDHGNIFSMSAAAFGFYLVMKAVNYVAKSRFIKTKVLDSMGPMFWLEYLEASQLDLLINFFLVGTKLGKDGVRGSLKASINFVVSVGFGMMMIGLVVTEIQLIRRKVYEDSVLKWHEIHGDFEKLEQEGEVDVEESRVELQEGELEEKEESFEDLKKDNYGYVRGGDPFALYESFEVRKKPPKTKEKEKKKEEKGKKMIDLKTAQKDLKAQVTMKKDSFVCKLMEEYNQDTWYQRYHHPIQLLKDILLSFSLVNLYDFPILQCFSVALILTSNLVLNYKHKPFKDKTKNSQSLFREMIFGIISIMFFLLSLTGGMLSQKTLHYVVGYPVIGLIIILVIKDVGSCVIETYRGFKEKIKFCRKKCKKNKKVGEKEKNQQTEQKGEEEKANNLKKEENKDNENSAQEESKRPLRRRSQAQSRPRGSRGSVSMDQPLFGPMTPQTSKNKIRVENRRIRNRHSDKRRSRFNKYKKQKEQQKKKKFEENEEKSKSQNLQENQGIVKYSFSRRRKSSKRRSMAGRKAL